MQLELPETRVAQLLTARQVAERLSVSLPTLERWIVAGKFPSPVFLTSRSRRWPEAVVAKWLAARRTAQ